VKRNTIPAHAALKGSTALKFDSAKVLAALERTSPKLANLRDRAIRLVSHHGGPLHIHDKETAIRGVYHLGLYMEGTYYPNDASPTAGHGGHHGSSHGTKPEDGEYFNRLLNVAIAVDERPRRTASTEIGKTRTAKRARKSK
jgi:hypothetical protein